MNQIIDEEEPDWFSFVKQVSRFIQVQEVFTESVTAEKIQELNVVDRKDERGYSLFLPAATYASNPNPIRAASVFMLKGTLLQNLFPLKFQISFVCFLLEKFEISTSYASGRDFSPI
jgi:hypothetical protein